MSLSDNEAWLRFCHDVGDALYDGDEPDEEEEEEEDGFRDGGVDENGESEETEEEDGIE